MKEGFQADNKQDYYDCKISAAVGQEMELWVVDSKGGMVSKLYTIRAMDQGFIRYVKMLLTLLM